jgi:hypothetical protein
MVYVVDVVGVPRGYAQQPVHCPHSQILPSHTLLSFPGPQHDQHSLGSCCAIIHPSFAHPAGVHFYGLGHWDKLAADERLGLGSKLACVVNPNHASAAAAEKQPAAAAASEPAGATPPPPEGPSAGASGELPGSGPSAADKEKDKEGGEKGSGLPKGER